jgi:hypothetical protein
VPWWGLLSAAAGFVFLVGGCTHATALQPASFNWLASTVTTLTERAAADPWVTSAAFAVTGACEMATMPGRLILAAAGAASVLVAANPEHVGGSLTHGLWAAVTFTALIAWPTGHGGGDLRRHGDCGQQYRPPPSGRSSPSSPGTSRS